MTTDKDNGLPARVEPLVPVTFDDTMSMAKVFAASGFFADSREAAQAVVKMLAGRELGFPPIASMQGIHIIKGKVGIGATLMAAAIQRSGRYRYRMIKHTTALCEIEFFDGGQSVGLSSYSMEEAKAAGLTENPTWQKYPKNMMFARALSNGVKWYCPGVFGGPVYTPEELEEIPDAPTPEGPPATAAPAPTPTADQLGTDVRKEETGEKPPSYEPWGAITMITELGGGTFKGAALETYFGAGVRTKSMLEKLKGENLDAFKAGYERLRADHKAGKAGTPAGVPA